jgi:hypothetical protein
MLIEEFNELQKLDQAIDNVLTEMSGVNAETEDFAKMADQLTKLIKAKEIIGNLKLKAFEATNKLTNDTNAFQLKSDELEQKKEEHELRRTETTHANNLRGTEIINRKAEVETGYVLKADELALKREELDLRRRVSADTWAIVGANIAGIALIIGYERINVIASKALGFVGKLR